MIHSFVLRPLITEQKKKKFCAKFACASEIRINLVELVNSEANWNV